MLQVLNVIAILTSALSLLFLSLCYLFHPSQYHGENQQDAKSVKGEPQEFTSVQIVVLGDIGRSPRMQYHAMSIAKHKGFVQIIGYCDSDPNPDLVSDSNISIIPLGSPPKKWQANNKMLFLLVAPLKVIFQVWSLWIVLGYRATPSKWMVVQNPPSIPTLLVAQIICLLRRTHLIIDWHNFGYSILGLKLGANHPLVKISKWYEQTLGRGATAHFCVTSAMAKVLKSDFGSESPILVLHDRPAEYFQPIPRKKRSSRLNYVLRSSTLPFIPDGSRLLVSSTSWTPDEDFSILLDALCMYSTQAQIKPHLPALSIIITGKGPQKAHYLSRIQALESAGKITNVAIHTAWLSIENYATLLACADLGVSLHTSSSGVDLPMKVVDMFGAGLPVVGWDRFEAWSELVKEGSNGMGFSSAEGLAERLEELFGGDGAVLERLRAGAMEESKRRWDDEWDTVAGRLLGFSGTSGKKKNVQ